MKRSETAAPRRILRFLWRTLLLLFTLVLVLCATLLASKRLICSNVSPAAKRVFVTTMLETGQLKFLASLFVPQDEIRALVASNALAEFNDSVDSSLITVGVSSGDVAQNEQQQQPDIAVEKISGRTFLGTMILLKDPSRLSVASIYPWREKGVTLDTLVKDSGAVGGINAGIYNSTNNTGGKPYGIVVCGGEIQFNQPEQFPGLVMIGLTEDNILQIVDINGKTAAQVESLVREMKIRDAIAFQEESTDANNHFVQLVINGEARELNGMGSGLNPRTAIGQRKDGTLLLLVTDGRGRNGHLGASASDLIDIMVEYGAINAANLDGGSSSCMYLNGEYLMDSVTFYYTNSSWRMPTAFVIH